MVRCVLLQGDATNRTIWKNNKLHVLRARSSYVMQKINSDDCKVVCLEDDIVCDLQLVQAGTGAETIALMKREMASIGLPVWSDIADRADMFWTYIFNSDAGPDEGRARKIAMMEAEFKANVQVWCVLCFLHQTNLIVREQLALVDKYFGYRFKCFSSLANICTCWRTDARGFYDTWRARYGDNSALDVAKRLPPQAIAGRWSSVANSERYIKAA